MAHQRGGENGDGPAMSFRRFIQELKDEQDLLEVNSEVDPYLELAAIIRRVYEEEEKAPLFNNIQGRNDNGLFRILGAPVGVSKIPGKRYIRIAKSLGLPSDATAADIIEKLNHAKTLPAIPSKEVPSGPVKEFKLVGDEIDLTALPMPFLHQHDGGKFIQTFGMYIVRSPDGSWVNWSITRAMLHGKRTLVGPVIPSQDIGVIREMWRQQGKDMPFALCFGVPPAAIMVSGMPLPKGVNESDYIGALTGSAVQVTRSETSDILVPANAELVFEGVVSSTETAPEGPMAEYHGLIFPGESHEKPLFRVDAITYRKDPIVPVCVAGRAVEENHTVWGVTQAAEVLSVCQAAGLPIKMVWNPFESHCLWFVLQVDGPKLRALNTDMSTFGNKVGHAVFTSKPGSYIPKLYLVGEDVDPTSIQDLIWAEATRCQPGVNEFYFDQYPVFPLIPYFTHGVKPEGGKYKKVLRCCMFPSEYTNAPRTWEQGSFRASYPQEVQDKVNAQWKSYGFE
ncbi:Ferulic acid decarboxylase 1 [Metarhizium acridum]|uniref:Ferulic acid decarboxylase 1 n=1 Tax=Metarhizium acridum TaxID=92637 RepID=UPI001C6B24EA|nr:Ferulic acid decarboxylase 1 [Metarhizium acridum]KAG8408513.1 Ferulic acid decarboxylase 1 [Metarhizium acridum]